MKLVWPAAVVVLLTVVALAGAQVAAGRLVLSVGLPYVAALTLLAGLVWRVASWARSPVPFRIPTTCGQQRALDWIPSSRLDNPSTGLGAAVRVLLEVVAFRSLFRGVRAHQRPDGKLVYRSEKLLWAAGLGFHASLLVIVLRHARLFFEPVPAFVTWLQAVDGFFAVGVPELYLSDVVLLAALAVLLGRRLADARLRYLSLPADYLPLLLLGAIAASGVLLRHFYRTDLVAVKNLVLSLASLRPDTSFAGGALAFVHLLLVCALAVYFPFSKLVHMAGVFMSPTRNLANSSRRVRHVNPWNAPVPYHTYAEWEDEFRQKLKTAGLPVEKE